MRILKTVLKTILPDDILYDIRKYYIRNQLEKGTYDNNEKEMQILKYLVKPGNTAIDIGANIGSYARALSKLVSPNGSVHAFEPIPLTYGYLVFNMRRNHYPNLVTYNAAIGHKLSLCHMILPSIGMEDIYQARIKNQGVTSGKEYIVPMVTLDSLYANCFKKVDFIKCDVEGAELLVFRGAEQVLAKNIPRIICEISSENEAPGKREVGAFQLLIDSRYQAYFFDGRKLVPCGSIDTRNKNSNYIFIHSDDPEADFIVKRINSD